jgi:hypothetical protein
MTVTNEQTLGWPWPTRADVTRGVERYFQFLQRQGDFNRQLAIGWLVAVPRMSRPVRGQTQGTRHPTAGHRDVVAEHGHHAGDDRTSDPGEHEPTERSAEQNLRRNDLFDSVIDGLIDADILANTQPIPHVRDR